MRGFVPRTILSGVLALGASMSAPAADTYRILHVFSDGQDGGGPYTPPVEAQSGTLYGTTNGGGPAQAGTIYRIAPDGTETVLHAFDGADGGKLPDGSPVLDPVTGDLYGTTGLGGTNDVGVLWNLSKRGKFSVLHMFGGAGDGKGPHGQLLRDSSGNFYGITGSGGAGYGAIFRYGADGKFKVLHAFSEEDYYPSPSLAIDKAGDLYGVTGKEVYTLTAGGEFKVLYVFTANDGQLPLGGLARDKAGNLYGTLSLYGKNGYGTAYQLTPNGKFTILHAFSGNQDGGYPGGDPVVAGNYVYGTTEIGGDKHCSCGVVFRMSLDGKGFAILHAFTGGPADGNTPFAGVSKGQDSLLYGTTYAGGANNDGVVFSLARNAN